MLDGDEADLGQHLQVVGDRGLANPDLLDDLADGHWSVAFDLVEAVVEFGAGVLAFGSWYS